MRNLSDLRAWGIFCALRLPVVLLCLLLSAASVAFAAAGKESKNAGNQPPRAVAAGRHTMSAEKAERDIYAQPPFTEKELIEFTEKLPFFLTWARTSKTAVHPIMNEAGRPDFLYTPEAAAKSRELNWEPKRFFCLLGRTAAALYLVEEGTDLADRLPKDMPFVTQSELALVRKHLGALLRAGTGGTAPTISR